MQKRNRLVIDTNLWLSWLINKKQNHLNKILADESIEIITSAEQIRELFDVLDRSKFRKHFSNEVADQFKLFFVESLTILTVNIEVKISRDSNDDFLLALAKTGKANYLLTGDKDLLVLEKFESTRIRTITEYLDYRLY